MIERYEDENIALVFGPVAERWLAVEVIQMHRIRGPEAAWRLQQVGPPDLARVAELELAARHEVFAFLQALDERIQDTGLEITPEQKSELRQWLHYGLTSSDVVDTAQALALDDAHGYLSHLAGALLAALSGLCLKAGQQPTYVMGRTHGQHAVPMPAEHRWQVLYGELVGAYQKALETHIDILQAKLSGPVGLASDESEQTSLRRLGLSSVLSTQLVPRDGLARWAQAQAGLATICEAIATQVWLLSQTEIAEITERRDSGQVGSSAMPHKTNPIRAENIRGLARLARMYADVLRAGVVQWGEHDLAHSCVERVALPDLCHIMATILRRTTALVGSIEFQSRPVPESYEDTHQRLLQLQRSGVPYVEAHERLRTGTYQDGTIVATETAAQRAGLIPDERFGE